jgi:hypothetical protein
MSTRAIYLALCVVGTIYPYWHALPFFQNYGLDLPRFVDQLFSTPVGAFFGADVIVSSVVLWVFVLTDGPRYGVQHTWAPLVANLAVGVSLGLPLFLFLREDARLRATAS